MIPIPYKVCIVVDREFGERLAEIERSVPVWIVGTPTNKAVAQRLWKENPRENHLTGITTFNDGASFAREDVLVGILQTIDLHHGPYSADPPYTIIEVIGTSLRSTIEKEMSAYGFNEFKATAEGFIARRPIPEIDPS